MIHTYCPQCNKKIEGEWGSCKEGYYPKFPRCECEKEDGTLENIQLNLAKISLSLNDIAASLRVLSSRPQSL